MKKLASLTLSLFLLSGPAFADSPKDTPKSADAQPAKAAATAKPATAKTSAEIAAEVEELRQALQAQQEQLQMLKEELAKRDREIEAAREAAASANAKAADASVKATEAVATSAEVKTTTTALNNSVASLASSNAAAVNAAVAANGGAGDAEEKGPTTIRFKGVSITPGGFIAAETVNRQRAESADINTQFNGIPYTANATGKLSEMNLTGRQSRLSMLFEGKVNDAKLSGYYEMDFLGAGTTSNNRQSNSYVMRQRQLFARADFSSGWSFTGGQMWSLATENKIGIINRNEWTPAVVDPQYVVGFTWARQYGFRVTKNFSDKFAIAFAAEAPQATVTAHGTSTYTSTSGATTTNTFYDSPGNSAGLYNAFDTTGYSINKAPDFIVKAALDPGWGHYEVFGILSTFQNRVYPCAVVSIQAPTATAVKYTSPDGTVYTGSYNSAVLSGAGALTPPAGCTNTTPSAVGAYTNSRTGGGFGASFDVPLVAKKFDLGLKAFYGDGTGRYGSSQLPDATLRPDGTLALIHGAHWLGRMEWHVTPKFDLYAYVGGEYAARAVYAGFLSVAGSTSTTNVTLTAAAPGAGDPVFITLPETVTTWKTGDTALGGYGYQTANNSACATEVAPSAVGTPSAGTCTGDTRYIGEGTLGFWHKFYQGDKGRFQWGIQYSYFYKTGWSGAAATGAPTGTPGIGPHAVDNMVWTSFRYYLP
jgi:hypothetical protein